MFINYVNNNKKKQFIDIAWESDFNWTNSDIEFFKYFSTESQANFHFILLLLLTEIDTSIDKELLKRAESNLTDGIR